MTTRTHIVIALITYARRRFDNRECVDCAAVGGKKTDTREKITIKHYCFSHVLYIFFIIVFREKRNRSGDLFDCYTDKTG